MTDRSVLAHHARLRPCKKAKDLLQIANDFIRLATDDSVTSTPAPSWLIRLSWHDARLCSCKNAKDLLQIANSFPANHLVSLIRSE